MNPYHKMAVVFGVTGGVILLLLLTWRLAIRDNEVAKDDLDLAMTTILVSCGGLIAILLAAAH